MGSLLTYDIKHGSNGLIFFCMGLVHIMSSNLINRGFYPNCGPWLAGANFGGP